MRFTGTELIRKRNFYSQGSNFAINCDLSLESKTGIYKIGVSGTNNFEVTFQDGKIFKDDLFLHSYSQFEPFTLEFQFGPAKYNFYKDNDPIIIGANKESGIYDYFYITRNDPTINANFDLVIEGNEYPDFTISETGYWLNSGQTEVTGYFVNNSSYNISVFSTTSLPLPGITLGQLTGVVTPNNTGYFKYRGLTPTLPLTTFDQPISTYFNANFGQAFVGFKIIDARTVESYVFLQPLTNFNFDGNNQILKTLTYNNYSGGVIADFPTQLVFSLEYVSGSGFFSESAGTYTTTGYGTFLESGLITGVASTLTGNILVQTTGWATGEAGGIFSGLGTGYGTGIGYSGLASGIFTGFLTGTIYDGSGKLLVGPSVGYINNDAVSIPTITPGTGLVYLSGVSVFYLSWNSGQFNTRPILRGQRTSGSPIFTPAGNNGTIRWGSGQDILYGISGMNSAFGITGWMSGSYLYLFTTGTIPASAHTRSIQAIEESLYFGSGYSINFNERYFTGAVSGVTPATGFLDLSNPLYTSNTNFTIFGYNNRSLSAIYRPKKNTVQRNLMFHTDTESYYGFYDDASGLAKIMNQYPNYPISGRAEGDKVYMYVKQLGASGNNFELYSFTSYGFIGWTGTEGPFTGGSPSNQASTWVRIYSNEELRNQVEPLTNANLVSLTAPGYFFIYDNSGSFYSEVSRFSAPPFTNNQDVYYLNDRDFIEAISGSAIQQLWADGRVFQNGSGTFLTSKISGPSGNLVYHITGNTNTTRRALTGGGITETYISVVPIGEYTGNLTNTFVTGSGTYSAIISETGSVFIKTFTGQWDILTGENPSSLVSIKNQYIDAQLFSTTGFYSPNSQMYFRIDHDPIYAVDEAIFRISGANVLNPLTQTLIQ